LETWVRSYYNVFKMHVPCHSWPQYSDIFHFNILLACYNVYGGVGPGIDEDGFTRVGEGSCVGYQSCTNFMGESQVLAC
jgi:hypothetical protein